MSLNSKILAASVVLALSSTAVMANEESKDVNYGDPTASFSTLGVSASKDATQINGMYGAGANIFQLDVTRQNKSGEFSGRGRYFRVTDGLGFSVDVLGDKHSRTALGGLIYKFQVTDNIMIFPMLSAGATSAKGIHAVPELYGNNAKADDSTKWETQGLVQAGVYAMYAFDAGHWLYANPKSTYLFKAKEYVNQVEVGGGFMIAPQASIGFKVEHTMDTKDAIGNKVKADTVTWLQANYYF
ncbi:hypothetical protein [Paraferrimonas haliotis]|uniref:Uncharacterized protein n=1 Tax=Paraferrimonas haliotis TaxID=2013866 RepID=A0AA37WYX1_9GAMM|nr:hypothetical protein [Paraferrimonas haliotis]GLS83586.1 hypothetical protein GCM10007894_15630 [Paraferrimonas haliotis]